MLYVYCEVKGILQDKTKTKNMDEAIAVHRHYSIVVMMLLPRSSTVRIVAATETVSRVLGARGSLYLELIAFEGLEKYMMVNFRRLLMKLYFDYKRDNNDYIKTVLISTGEGIVAGVTVVCSNLSLL